MYRKSSCKSDTESDQIWFFCTFCCFQISVDAPWLSDIQSSCALIGKGTLICVDPAAVSLHMIDLHSEAEMTQMPLQVEQIILLSSCQIRIVSPLFCSVKIWVSVMFQVFGCFSGFWIYFTISIVLRIFLQSLGLEARPGFRPVLISSQPNPARQALSEFFLQLGPERYFLLQLDNGQIVTLRDFSPVCSSLSLFLCSFLMCLSGFVKVDSATLVSYSICHLTVLNFLY